MNAIKKALLGLYGVIGLFVALVGIRLPFAETLAKQHYRYAIAGVLVILSILSIVIGVFILSFNANNFKTEIVRYVKEHTQRDLVLQGDIKATFFPKLGLDTGKMTLSQRNSAREFASVNDARLYIAWLPLLRMQIVFDHVEIDGARINLTRFKDGTANYDDLLVHDASLAPVKFDIDNMRITNSSLNWQDEMKWQRVALQNLQVETGSLVDTVPSHLKASFHLNSEVAHSDSNIEFKSRMFYDRKEGRYEFAGIEGTLQGTAAGFSNLDLKFNGDLDDHAAQELLSVENIVVTGKGNFGQRSIETSLGIPKLQYAKSILSGSQLTLDATLSQFDEKWIAAVQMPDFELANRVFNAKQFSADFDFKSNTGTLQGKLSSPISVDFDTAHKLLLNAISMDISANHPMLAGELSAKVTGKLQADLAERNAKLDLIAKIDDSKITGEMALTDFSHPAYTFDLGINRLPLDRYISDEWIKRYQNDATRIDLSGFKVTNLRGTLHAGEFKMAGLEGSKLSAEIRIEQSSLTIDPLAARMYGGNLAGSISVAAQRTPQITIRQKLRGFQANALLAGTADTGKLTGKGDLAMDISAEGSSIGALRKTLSGSVSLVLARGSLAGIDLRTALTDGKDDLGITGRARVHEYRFSESTEFSELKAVFNIKDGSSRGNSFTLRSPLLRISGEGDFSPNTGNIDYKLAATVAAALKRRSAGDLAELRGVTVPIRATGPYTAPSIALDFGAGSGDVVTKAIAARAAAEKAATASSAPKRSVPRKKHVPKATKK